MLSIQLRQLFIWYVRYAMHKHCVQYVCAKLAIGRDVSGNTLQAVLGLSTTLNLLQLQQFHYTGCCAGLTEFTPA